MSRSVKTGMMSFAHCACARVRASASGDRAGKHVFCERPFLANVWERRSPSAGGEDVLRTREVALAGYESSRTGQFIEIRRTHVEGV